MGFFDNINPFKKKDDFGLLPMDNLGDSTPSYSHESTPNFGDGLGHDPVDGHSDATFTAPDPKMNMPLGENVRQQRIEAMHGQNDYHEPVQSNPLQKDLELISSKLDYLKASLEAINQRLANLEHMSRNQENQKKW
jgi:hypothetical protein